MLHRSILFAVHGGIISFWLASLGNLAYREALFPWLNSRGEIFLSSSIPLSPQANESWMGIYADRIKIGYLHKVQIPSPDVPGGTLIQDEGRVVLSMLGERRDIFFASESSLDSEGQLLKFMAKLQIWPTTITVQGQREGDLVQLTFQQGKTKWTSSIPVPPSSIPLVYLPQLVSSGQLQEGERFRFALMDPLNLQMGDVEVEVQNKRMFPYGTEHPMATPVNVHFQGISTTSWIAEDGTVLQEESPLGWVLQREDRERAVQIDLAQWRHPPDLLAMVAVPSEVWIRLPREVTSLRVSIRRPDRPGAEEMSIQPTGPPATPIKRPVSDPSFAVDLEATLFIQVADPQIRRKVEVVVGSETDAWAAACALNDWVYQSVRKVPTLGLPISSEVLRRLEGDCNEHTCLYVALARASGIPCRIVMGVVYFEGAFVYHTWPKVYVGRWVDVDPTLGQAPVDATHIPLMEADLEKSVQLTSLVGQLRIQVLEYQ